MGQKNNASGLSLEAIGEKLKVAREKKGVTIDQAQRQTHIHSTVLVALESGRADEVLTPTYVKSFLKRYSSYLGLDPSQSVKEYMALHPEFDSPGMNLAPDDEKSFKSRPHIGGYLRIIRNLCLVAAGIALLAVTVRGVVRFIKAPHKTPAAKAGLRAKAPRAVPAKTAANKAADKPQTSQISIPNSEPITLTMKVKADVFVGVKRDGVVLFRRLLSKGAVETFTADGKLNVSIAKARSVELFLNGRPLDPPGKGVITDLEITRKGIKVK